MDELGLLCRIVPELEEARGVAQPKEHYWDVFDHCVETVGQVERLLQSEECSGFLGDDIPVRRLRLLLPARKRRSHEAQSAKIGRIAS